MFFEYITLFFNCTIFVTLIFIIFKITKNDQQKNDINLVINKIFSDTKLEQEQYFSKLQSQILEHMRTQANESHQNQLKNLEFINNNLNNTLKNYSTQMSSNFDNLIKTADNKLQAISNEVDKKLSTGFEKTNATFTNISERLALIDNAQQKLSELSSNIISLQDILADKRSRGAFGEVQLKNLITNMLSPANYGFQHTFSNGNRADCVLFLPEPTGTIAVDAKFPLENYYLLINEPTGSANQIKASQNFKTDIKKHINAIADKYIITNETSDAAVMFIPAEAVFAEIHRTFPELVEYAHHRKIFLASPTTMMAILTTASAVIKDFETKKHVDIIQQHLKMLAKDFSRFELRMEKLTSNIEKARTEANSVNTSAKKIAAKFKKIEEVQISEESSTEELVNLPD